GANRGDYRRSLAFGKRVASDVLGSAASRLSSTCTRGGSVKLGTSSGLRASRRSETSHQSLDEPAPKWLHDCGGLQGTGGDSRGLEGAADSAENRAWATEVARHRSFRLNLDAGSIPAASTKSKRTRCEAGGRQRAPSTTSAPRASSVRP